eukprot:s760_g6.t1
MRFRLWRCSLQICVSSPALAPLAEIPFALASAAAEAPPGAPELLAEALELGADPEAFIWGPQYNPLKLRLPALPQKAKKLPPAIGIPSDLATPRLLLAPADALAVEAQRRQELAALGVDIEVWAPADVEAATSKLYGVSSSGISHPRPSAISSVQVYSFRLRLVLVGL